MSVNYEDKNWKGIEIKAGSTVTSWDRISLECGLTVQQARTAMGKLESNKQIIRKSTNKNQLITLVKWDKLQGLSNEDNKQTTNNPTGQQQANNKPATTTKESKEGKEVLLIPEVVSLWNEITGQSSKPAAAKNKTVIQARINEGFTIDDFQSVARSKYKEWIGTENQKYIRIETVFGNKMDGYLQAAKMVEPASARILKYDHTRLKEGETYFQRFVRNKIDPRETKEVEIFIEEEGLDLSMAKIIQSHFHHTPEKFPYVQD
jgi:uncharacterized phage protein (TIGR02220 family)